MDYFEAAKMNYVQKFISSMWDPGDIRYKDLNGDGMIDQGNRTLANPGDQKVIGNSSTRYRFNLQGGIGWRGFDIRAIFEGVGKRDMWTSSDIFWGFSRGIYNSCVTQYHIDNFWTYEIPTAYYPRLNATKCGIYPLERYYFELYYTQELVGQDENGAGTYLCKWYEFVGEDWFAPIYDS